MSGKISLALNGRNKPINGVKRSHAALQEEEDEDNEYGRSETVSHFDKKAGGAIDEKRKEDQGPLVIAKQANRDWREAANKRRRQKSGLPDGANGDVDADQRMKAVEAADVAKKPGFGLNLFKKGEEDGGEEASRAEEVPESEQPEPAAQEPPARRKTEDELAMDALLGRTTQDKSLTIVTEEDAFRNDYEGAPDMSTLDDYARVPVEQFGAALLRGMGWKEGEGIGSQKGKRLPKDDNKLPERRANLLGIGAKEDAALAAEMGAWGKGGRGKEVKIYNPVLVKDKKTGKMYTEDELQQKKERDERERYEAEFEKKERRREKESRRDDGHDRDRRRDMDRRKREDEESEEEYHRRKEKERRRRDRDRDDDYDRERSRRHRERDSDRHHRDSDRDRERDRRRDRDRDGRDRRR
ncbi:Pre-mRNA-splicing factor spp2 [Lecanosticta acicola]|uniref:Pre-mRNA-splicing factor n=1 Tax=Lecanosticta acicola TaxID=111012 RepID=A0AAI8YTE3_9PEZI|nr:Pre-mRNA-splicing factor spp2 [Lecanosticta acicola]